MLTLLTVLVVPALTAGAQTSGTLSGRVEDATGAVVPGVTISVRHLERGVERETVTGSDGRFVLAALPVGAYDVRAELSGFKPVVRQGVALTVGEAVAIEFTLEVGGLAEAVSVVGAAPAVNTRTGELSYLVEARTIEQLPLNGRNYTDLAFLQPGVTPYPYRDGGSVVAHGLGMSVNGQDPRANVYLLDGTLLNDMTNGPAGSAAGTSLGTETVQEFRVETNAYGAEFGRMSGGQVNVITKAGSNTLSGTAYEYHRNDALDARNYFDVGTKPAFTRNQFGVTAGGPVRENKLFYFLGYEGLRENLGRTITSAVPDANARRGLLPDPANPGQFINVGVNAAVAPYLNEYPVPNGANLGDGTALHSFQFDQTIDQNFLQGRVDYNLSPGSQFFARYTLDDADQRLPLDYPQFPRAFVSRNQFFTAELKQAFSSDLLATYRGGYSRTRVGQDVEANTTLPPFVPGREFMGNIDVGGLQRFGTQASVDVRFLQQVTSFSGDLVWTRGRHLIRTGALAEHYRQDMVNPTFSLGTYSFANLRAFMENRATSFIGLTSVAQFDRQWPFWLAGGYVQDEWLAHERLTVTAGLRYEFMTMPIDTGGHDSALVNLTDRTATVGQLYEGADYNNFSPRLGLSWDVAGDGRTAVRGGYGLYYATNSSQNLIVTVTNPPDTPRVVYQAPTFPNPPFERAFGLSIRPVQWDGVTPSIHVWNANLQRELPGQMALTLGYAGSRGYDLLRSSDLNTAVPTTGADGRPFFPVGGPRQNTAWTTIEAKTSDGDSWYKALIVDVRRRFADGWSYQASYTWSDSQDTTQASTFFSDATNGTTSAFPEYIAGYNRGPSDFDVRHNLVANATWDIPWGRDLTGAAGAVLGGWRLSVIGTYRSGYPLTVFVQNNRSRSLWQPSLGPGIGRDRPNYAPGFSAENAVTGNPEQWFNPLAFALQPAGTFGDTGRGDFRGPDLRVVDLAMSKDTSLGGSRRVEVRVEVFNLFNRANFGVPNLTAFAGAADGEAALGSFGRIRNTVTSARQVQLGVRLRF
ncbi:MAG: carboxypeptidase regulatory-like domain-containing protein [Acidobacteriota bacterium]|nr:carboxypeptidase regulatory-like domain-containing protein [Acidobacteriota bacterium]